MCFCTQRSPQSSDSRIRNSGGRIEKEEREWAKRRRVFFFMEQDESGSDETAAEGDDTSYGLAELVNSRIFFSRRRRRACTKTSASTQGNIWDDKDSLSCRTSAVVPTATWPVKNILMQHNIEQGKSGFARLYLYLYLPIAFNSKEIKGYAFVNLVGSTAGKSLLGVLMGSLCQDTRDYYGDERQKTVKLFLLDDNTFGRSCEETRRTQKRPSTSAPSERSGGSVSAWAFGTTRCHGQGRCTFTKEKHRQIVGFDRVHRCSRPRMPQTCPTKRRLANLLWEPTLTARMQRTCYDLGMQRER